MHVYLVLSLHFTRRLGSYVVLRRGRHDGRLGGILLVEPQHRLLAHLLVAPVVVLPRARLASVARGLPRGVVVHQPSLRPRLRYRARVEHRGIGLDGAISSPSFGSLAPLNFVNLVASPAGSRAWDPSSLRVHQRLHLLGAAQVLAALGAPDAHLAGCLFLPSSVPPTVS